MKTTAKLTRLEREYLLTNAEINMCINYWCQIQEFHYSPYHEPNYRILSIDIAYSAAKNEDEYPDHITLDHKTIQKGIDALMAADGYESIKADIIEGDDDIETTDVIIQFALFGELVYG